MQSRPLKQLTQCFVTFITLCGVIGCSTVYDNTVGLLDDDTPTSAESVETPTSPSVEDSINISKKRVTPPTSNVSVESGNPPTKTDDVEIMWEIPQEEVEHFILQYGYTQDALSQEQKIPVDEIEKYQDPNYGPVYRYVLKGVPAKTKLYVRLASENDEEQSEFSEVFEVAPQE